jgi:hypothetical protein
MCLLASNGAIVVEVGRKSAVASRSICDQLSSSVRRLSSSTAPRSANLDVIKIEACRSGVTSVLYVTRNDLPDKTRCKVRRGSETAIGTAHQNHDQELPQQSDSLCGDNTETTLRRNVVTDTSRPTPLPSEYRSFIFRGRWLISRQIIPTSRRKAAMEGTFSALLALWLAGR